MTAVSRLIAAERITRTVKGRQRPLVTTITQGTVIRAENKLDRIDAKSWAPLPDPCVYINIICFKNPALISSFPLIVNVLIFQIIFLHSAEKKKWKGNKGPT